MKRPDTTVREEPVTEEVSPPPTARALCVRCGKPIGTPGIGQCWYEAACAIESHVNALRRELDEERAKVGLLMQPVPEVHGDFPWQMMRLWCANRDVEKREHRDEVRRLRERIAELESRSAHPKESERAP